MIWPHTPHVEVVHINAWNLSPTLELLHRAGLLPPEFALRHEPLAVSVTAAGAEEIAAFLSVYLRTLQPPERVLLDGTTTSDPDDHTMNHDDPELNYSATYPWLAEFRDFCAVCCGFDISP